MAGYQFIHYELYARSAPKKSEGKASLRGVVDEALRKPAACPHVAAPRAPIFLKGSASDVEAMASRIEREAAQAKDSRGHKLRKDAAVLLAGVVSLPGGYPDGQRAAWEGRTLAFLDREFGNRLVAVLSHGDEVYHHLHFMVEPDLSMGTAKMLHRGHVAADGVSRADGKAAYRQAMVGFQDDFWEQVGRPSGLTRRGPGRRRLTRRGWREEQDQADTLARMIEVRDESQLALEAAERDRQNIEAQQAMERQAIADERAKLAADRRLLEQHRQRLDAENTKLQADKRQLIAERQQVDIERTKLVRLRDQLGHALDEAHQLVKWSAELFRMARATWPAQFQRLSERVVHVAQQWRIELHDPEPPAPTP